MISLAVFACMPGGLAQDKPAEQINSASTSPADSQDSKDAAAKPEKSTNDKWIDYWEGQFFSRSFTNEPIDQRLGRIEQLVFGTKVVGDEDERVHKLIGALNQQGMGPALPPGVAEFTKPQAPPAAPPTPPAQAANSPAPPIAQAQANESAAPPSPQTQGNESAPSPAPSMIPAEVIAEPVAPKTNASPAPSSMPIPVLGNASAGATLPIRLAVLKISKEHFETRMKPNQIIQNLNEAISLNPLDPDLMYQRAKAYIQLDKLDKALSDLCDAIMNQPNRSEFYLARAWIYHLQGNPFLADKDLSQARFVDPKFPEKIEWE